jgi:spore coat polysaccharide biosynthesis protein SpsF
MKVAAIIQARMGSTRLPGKVLMPMPIPVYRKSDIQAKTDSLKKSDTSSENNQFQHADSQQEIGQTILGRLVSSLKSVQGIHEIWIATTEQTADDVLEKAAEALGIRVFRGSENDVLSRFWGIIEHHDYDCVFRFTADNPCVDVQAVEFTLNQHNPKQFDYTRLNGMPIGMHVEIINTKTLLDLKNDNQLALEDHEHVTTFIKRNDGFRKNMLQLNDYLAYLKLQPSTGLINQPNMPLSFSEEGQQQLTQLRMTIDHEQDYLKVSSFFEFLDSRSVNAETPVFPELLLQWLSQ